MTAGRERVAFLFDVDDTLLDNDRVKRDLEAAVRSTVGPEAGQRFWEIYEETRRDCDFVDFPHTLERFTRELPEEAGYPALADAILAYPYARAVLPGARDVLRHAGRVGPTAILSDGDPVFQPAKIARAGFAADVEGRVFVFAHKEDHLAEIERRIPAERYVLVDDKPRILAVTKDRLGSRLVTVHVCQGKYAHMLEHDRYPPADRSYDTIADLLHLDLDDLLESHA